MRRELYVWTIIIILPAPCCQFQKYVYPTNVTPFAHIASVTITYNKLSRVLYIPNAFTIDFLSSVFLSPAEKGGWWQSIGWQNNMSMYLKRKSYLHIKKTFDSWLNPYWNKHRKYWIKRAKLQRKSIRIWKSWILTVVILIIKHQVTPRAPTFSNCSISH